MEQVADINKHKNEFRLRILVTNACNRRCKFCLNDFQSLNALPRMIDKDLAKEYIRAYGKYMEEKGKKAILNISGGEPGIYKYLAELVTCGLASNVYTIVNTNGMVFQCMDWLILKHNTGKIRVHVLPGQMDNYKALTNVPVEIQVVYTDDMSDIEGEELVRYYTDLDLPIKFFVDFYGDSKLEARYVNFIQTMRSKYPDKTIKARYTGIQQNRGIGCEGCTNKCITLKALWLFPNGMANTCPQIESHAFPKAKTKADIRDHIDKAYKFHMSGCKDT